MMSGVQFTPEEWSLLGEAPLLAAARVVAAESGGTLRENLAVRRVYAAARELRGESPLLDELVAESPELDVKQLVDDDERNPPGAGNARLQAALAVVKTKATPEDADAYKGFVLAVIQTVAEANREGGFAGIGGEEVSEREQAALDEITMLLEQ